MNKKFEEGLKQLDKAFKLMGNGIEEVVDDFLKNPPEATISNNKTNKESDVIHIRISSKEDRRKAAWILLTKGEITFRKKK
jgi:hypothetical protein